MKCVTATEARKNWFRLLDEVAAGEVVVVERRGERVVIRRQPGPRRARARPDYRRLLRVPGADQADRWSWEWRGPGLDLIAVKPSGRR